MTQLPDRDLCASCGNVFPEGQKCSRCQPPFLFCVPCAARNLHDLTASGPPPRAHYVVDGRSMCGECALPYLYAFSNRRIHNKPKRAQSAEAQPLFTALDEARTEAGRPSVRLLAGAFVARDHPVSPSSVHDWLTGKRIPSRQVVETFADVLGADKDKLLRLWKAAF